MSDLTETDLSRVRIRLADLPGLDPVGLVVWQGRETAVQLIAIAANLGVVKRPQGDDQSGAAFLLGLPATVCLNLADASTRDRVARWVAGPAGKRASFAPKLVVHGTRGQAWVTFEDVDNELFSGDPPRWTGSVGHLRDSTTRAVNACEPKSFALSVNKFLQDDVAVDILFANDKMMKTFTDSKKLRAQFGADPAGRILRPAG